ncbi:MAG TPA: GAF domain-containing protein, partial [Polyangia bacterium]
AARDLVARIEANAGASLGKLRPLAQPKIATLADYIGIPRGVVALVQSRIETLAAFIGIARAVIALVRGGRLEVLAATGPAALATGFDLGAAVPQACEVLETGSSLLLPDASAHPFSSVSRSLGGIRFFAGVPLRVGGVAVGVVCLFDPSVQRLEGEELAALERFGRRGSDRLLRFAEAGDAERPVQSRGLVVREMFEELLDAELQILDRRGGSMELAVLDVRDLAAVEAAIARAASPTRLLATMLSSTRVALFKRALDDSARRQVAAIVDELRARGEPRALGIVDLPDGGVRGFAARDLVRVAAIALDRALDRGGGLRRVVIEEEPVVGFREVNWGD